MRLADVGLLVLRVGVGGTLLAHGLPKLFGGEGSAPPEALATIMGPNYPKAWSESGPERFSAALGKMGVPMPTLAARASGIAEAGGGAALIAGLGFPLANLVVVGNMAVAIRKAHWKNGFYGQGGHEFATALGVGALALALTGPGQLSIDRLFRR